MEYWIIGSKNEILPIEMIKGFIRLMKPILFLSSIIPSLHYSSYSIFRQSQLPLTWPIEDPAMRGRTRFSGFNKRDTIMASAECRKKMLFVVIVLLAAATGCATNRAVDRMAQELYSRSTFVAPLPPHAFASDGCSC